MAKPTRSTKGGNPLPPEHNYTFPTIASKDYLECRTLLDDQILLIDNFLTAAECKNYVQFIDNLPLELTPPKKRGEAERNNCQSIFDPLCGILWAVALAIPAPRPFSSYPSTWRSAESHHSPVDCNSNIRLYKYNPGQHFGPHYDDSVRDPATGLESEWTILIYLTGVEDGVEGGETIFYNEQKGKAREAITAPLTRGTALLHRHGSECLLHEGSPVRKGTKYILRSDLMFKY
ncbi:hypothetical protein EYR38_003958 [Pleurotus pulmonarius]|nr:hypothetical protein EYR38_003958 [Pleurotus pulmonarius]